MKTLLAAAAAFAVMTAAFAEPPLKQAYKGDFVVGAAMNARQITGKDRLGDTLLKTYFNSISPENALKWEVVHPKPGKFNFTLADRYVAFGRKHHMVTVGHVLVWHNQTPDWVFKDDHGNPIDRKGLLARLKQHIFTVVGRYKGRIKAWDVVNEAIDEDGSMRQTPWLKIIGPDFIEQAFRYAHAADPKAELTYNDYNIESGAKHAAAVALIKKLKDDGVPVTTVGIQGHYVLDSNAAAELDTAIADFAALGVKVAITELDIDVLPRKDIPATADINVNIAQDPALNPYVAGLPDAVQKELADRYAAIFAVCLKHRETVERVTLWGITDADTWHNNWPVRGRTAYSLLFDRAGQPKPAYDAVIKAARE